MPAAPKDPAEFVPLKPALHLALLLLAEKPTYGVELLDRLEARSEGRLRMNAGSLYRMIAQLVRDGLVEPVEEAPSSAGVGAPRKIYGATTLGRAVLRAEAERQAGLVSMARDLDLLGQDS